MSNIYVTSGTNSGTTVSTIQTMYVYSSGTADDTLVYGEQRVYSGGVANSAIVDGGGQFVNSGGRVFDTEVYGLGQLDVGLGGIARGGFVSGGGGVYVSGGTIFGEQVKSGGVIRAEANGTTSALVVSNGGSATFYANGVSSDTVISTGGTAYVLSGGSAYATDIDSNGFMTLGGIASSTNVRGTEVIGSGGVQSASTVYEGGALSLEGTDIAGSIDSGGNLYVASGGRALGETIGSGGFAEIDPGGAGTLTISAGGTEVLIQGGVDTTVLDGAFLIDAQGASLSAAQIANAANIILNGVAVRSIGGIVTSYAAVDHLTLSGAQQFIFVLSGGSAQNVIVAQNAGAEVFSGGTATGFILEQAGLIVYTGGAIVSTTLSGGDISLSGGTADVTSVSSGGGESGELNVYKAETSGTTVGAGGEEVLYAGAVSNNTVIQSGGRQYDYFTSAGTGSSFDTMVESGGLQYVESGGVAYNTVIDGGEVDLRDGAISGSIEFRGSGGVLFVEQNTLPTATIFGFGPTDSIIYNGFNGSAGEFYSVSVTSPGVVTIYSGFDGTRVLNIAGATEATNFVAQGNADGFLVLTEDAPCFVAGTRILTLHGEIEVEHLSVGDTVITRDGNDAPIIWIGRRSIEIKRHARPETVQPIRIAAGAFADDVPRRDLFLSPDHALFIDDVLVPAKALVNNQAVTRQDCARVIYYHLELAEHAIIFAENCAAESYLETGKRGAFENSAAAITLHPDFAQTLRLQKSCAPFTETGPIVGDIAQRLARRWAQQMFNRRYALPM